MAYSEKLAGKIRQALAHLPKVKEKKMFGGMAFMVGEKLCLTAGADRMMCRIDPDIHETAIKRKGCRTVIMKGRAHLAAVLDSIERTAPDATLMVLESKAAAADTVSLVTDIAMKAAGGTGFNRSLGLERRFRDARAADFLGVTSDAFLEFIGRALCGMPVP